MASLAQILTTSCEVVAFDHSAESRRAMRLALAMMGTPGLKLRNAKGNVAAMFAHYRTAQHSVGGPGALRGTPASWRAIVRQSVAAARALQVAA